VNDDLASGPEMTNASSDLARVTACIGVFPADVVGQIILASSDLCMLVGPDLVVQDVIAGFALQDIACTSWRRTSLRALVGPEGQRKLDLLWTDATVPQTGWRHLNFKTDHPTERLPLLVQRIAATDGNSVLVCRDLRPSVRMQEQFNRVMIEMEQRREDIHDLFAPVPAPIDPGHDHGQGAASVLDARSAQADALVRRAFADLGQQPLSNIVQQTARVLEEMCIREAYAQCDHDLPATAALLGLNPDDLAQRMVFFQRKA